MSWKLVYRLITMSNVVGKEERAEALYEILIYSLCDTRACKRLWKGIYQIKLSVVVANRNHFSKSMKYNNNYYYDINKKFLSIIGQWPYQKPKAKLFFLAFALIFLSNSFVTQVILIGKGNF